MSTINQTIVSRVEAFVSDLNELLREAAVQSIQDALEAQGFGRVEAPRRGRGRVTSAPSEGRGGASSSRGAKRTAEELERISSRLVAFVEAHAGLGVEEISRGLGFSSKELTLPVRKLIAEGKLSTTGQKRATKYFAGRSKPQRGRGRK